MFDATNTQHALVGLGYPVKTDGVLGPVTMLALLRQASQRYAHVELMPDLAAALVQYLPRGLITTPLRLRHFLAQGACETDGFTRLVESDGGNPRYFDRYEGRKDLGNTQAGDGARFRGRGWLDTTGRYNYRAIGQLIGADLEASPDLLAAPGYAVLSGVMYWDHRHINNAADDNDIQAVTRAVNGGLNGLDDREIYFKRLEVIQ